MIIQINLKLTFTENYPYEIPEITLLDTQSILFPKYLRSALLDKISEWKKNLQKNPELIKIGIINELILQLLDLIEKNKFNITFSETEIDNRNFSYNIAKGQENNIIPYPKTCGFCWNPNGQILSFNYHKIDFSNLKKSDKIISNFNDLDDWIQYCKSTDKRKKFSKKENKLFDDDINMIIYDKFTDLIDVKSIIETEESSVLLNINKRESLPILFNRNIGMEIQQDHYGVNNNNAFGIINPFNTFINNNINNLNININNNSSLKKNVYSMTMMENHHDLFSEKLRKNSITESDNSNNDYIINVYNTNDQYNIIEEKNDDKRKYEFNKISNNFNTYDVNILPKSPSCKIIKYNNI